MRSNMRKAIIAVGIVLGVWLGIASGVQASAGQSAPDEKLFQESKLLIFDKKWDAALAKLQELMDAYPKSAYSGQALFYKAECLSSLDGREREALRVYKDYVRLPDANASLVEESEGSIIDLACKLYDKGDKAAIKDVETRLDHANKVIQYYAAYKLSLVPDKSIAAKGVPVLKEVVENEKDPELRDRARIALMRVSPESLQPDEARRSPAGQPHLLRIRILKKGQREPALAINIPWALADLALSAMNEEDKAAIRKKGYDINKIMNDLAKSKEKLIRIEAEDGSIIEIWIE